jgi:translocation and assembly module TamB
VVLNRFDLAMIKPFLGPRHAAQRRVHRSRGRELESRAEALPQAKVSLSGKGVKVQQLVQGNPLPIAFDTLNLNAGLNQWSRELDWLIRRLPTTASWTVTFRLPILRGERNLSGERQYHPHLDGDVAIRH